MKSPIYIEVILPLAIPKALSYAVPPEWEDHIKLGVRVVVPLGKEKKYAAIVVSVHNDPPEHYDPKYLESILDDTPIVNQNQLRFWQWMADYYLCTIGEIMQAALPSGFKLDPSTVFSLVEGVDPEDPSLSSEERSVLYALAANGSLTKEQLFKLTSIKYLEKHLSKLLELHFIIHEQELKQQYKPKFETHVKLGEQFDMSTMQETLDTLLLKSKKQHQLLSTVIQAYLNNADGKELTKKELFTRAQVTDHGALKLLVNKGLLHSYTKQINRLSNHLIPSKGIPVLTQSQEQAKQEIISLWKDHDCVLLHGITGSGKTAIYANLIESQIQQGKQVLFLVPEIALTTQIVGRLKQYFGKRAGVYHSGYSSNERTETWSKVIHPNPGECDLIIGARSSLFLPFSRLGLIIVDEEHDSSYKQNDPSPRYHGRDAAVILAKIHRCKIILGSATPSIESYRNVEIQRYGYVLLNSRFSDVSLPAIELVDLNFNRKEKKMIGAFTQSTLGDIEQVIEAKNQVIVFQNRRGYTPQWQCQTCGWIPRCMRCDVSLTYHKFDHNLKCHYCGYHETPPQRCNVCNSTDLKMLGSGTEKIEEELQHIWPDYKIQRFDSDTTRNKNSQSTIIDQFSKGAIDILIGTQMVTKGLDFEHVQLVVVVHADRQLAFPDFRATERTFQTLVQVAGRSGRGTERGKVLLQTTQPDHWIYALVQANDYVAFYKKEITERYNFAYPPFVRLVSIELKNKNESMLLETAQFLHAKLNQLFPQAVMGPEKPFVSKVNLYHIRHFTLRLANNNTLVAEKEKIRSLIAQLKITPPHNKTRFNIDVDPQ